MSRREPARTGAKRAAKAAPAPAPAPEKPAARPRFAWLRAFGRLVWRHPTASLTLSLGSLALGSVYANLVLMQPGPHPAPLFSTRPQAAVANARLTLLRDIQQGLVDRGYMSGATDGLMDRRTGDAIRDFESAQGLSVTGQPSEALLAQLTVAPRRRFEPGNAATTGGDGGAQPQARATAVEKAAAPAGAAGAAADPRAEVKKVQKALADLGYGPLQVDGRMGGQTAAAIRRFRADHGLPAGEGIDGRLVETLVAIGGMVKS